MSAIIPTSIFHNDKLSVLEAIVKYMKEELDFRTIRIAELLNRNEKTIWTTYNKSKGKMKERLEVKPGKAVPVSIFRPRLLSVLETLVEFLKEKGMSFHEIAAALNRDDRTIWTVCKRGTNKRKII